MRKILILSLFLIVAAGAVAATFNEIKESAILGDKEAMYQLSKAYMEKENYERSDYWLERAAQEGQADAKEVLKMMGGKTELTVERRSQLADEEKREREQLLAEEAAALKRRARASAEKRIKAEQEARDSYEKSKKNKGKKKK